MALGATPDHGGGCLVSGDVWVGAAPVLVTPDAAVGGIDRQQLDAGAGGHAGDPVAENRGWDPGHGGAEALPARATSRGFSSRGARVGEIEVFDRDGSDVMAPGVVQQSRDG